MRPRTTIALTTALVAAVSMVGLTGSSSATWIDSSTATSTVRAAADWTPPTVEIRQPAPSARGTLTIEVEASDAETGVSAVELQRRPIGGTWQSLGTTHEPPFTFMWDTNAVADGTHELRAVATDGAGHRTTSEVVRVAVVNQTTVALTHPGERIRGDVPLSATITAAGSLSWAARFEASVAGSGDWQPLSPAVAAPHAWSWKTTLGADGRYDLRVVATSDSLRIVSSVAANVLVDNTAPTVALNVPTGTLTGVISVSTTAHDALSGLATVVLQSSPTANGPWTDLATTTAAATTHRVDTTTFPYGDHFFRAVATDRAGNRTISTVVGPRLVDNTVRSIALASPGSWLEGTVTLNADATSTAQIASVRFQRSVAGRDNWTDIGTDTTAPWSFAWDTRTVTDGSHDLRAVLTDVNGNRAVSAVLPARTIDNVTTPFRGVDVQTTNAGTAGLVEVDDRMIFTFSRRVDLASITPGWDGTPLPVRLEITDAGFWYGVTDDDLTITRPGSTVNLGSVRITANLLAKRDVPTSFDATLTATTENVDGKPRTVVTVQVGTLLNGEVRRTDLGSTMTWTPSSQIKSFSGQNLAAGAITESGSYDKDF